MHQLRQFAAAAGLATLILGCGDPIAEVRIRNETDREYILAWVEAGTSGDSIYTDSVRLPPRAQGTAYSTIGPAIDNWTFLLLTPTCDIASAIIAGGSDINLAVTARQGWLDTVDGPIDGGQLARSIECITP